MSLVYAPDFSLRSLCHRKKDGAWSRSLLLTQCALLRVLDTVNHSRIGFTQAHCGQMPCLLLQVSQHSPHDKHSVSHPMINILSHSV